MQKKVLLLCLDKYATSGREALEVELGVKPNHMKDHIKVFLHKVRILYYMIKTLVGQFVFTHTQNEHLKIIINVNYQLII